jgi:hypothetical protein
VLHAQIFSFGVKAGVPVTNDMDSYFATSETRRYVVGPMAVVRLPLGFGVEFDALYRRAGYRVFSSDIFGTFTQVSRGNSWEFPLLLRHTIAGGVYGAVGYAGRAINGSSHYNQIVNGFGIVATTFQQGNLPGDWETTHGVVAAAGIEKRLWRLPLRLAPEVRYTYWTRPAVEVFGSRGFSVVSTQHQVDVMLGITFP